MAKVLIELLIFFDPVQTQWTTYDQFESFMGKSLGAVGLEGEMVQTIGGAVSRKIILIKKKQEVAPLNAPNTSTQSAKAIKEQLESLKLQPVSEEKKRIVKGEKFKKGRFLKTKGYLKK